MESNIEYLTNRTKLLSKSVWTYKDIMEFDNNVNSSSTAERIKTRAIKKFNGAVPYSTKYVKTDAVLQIYGTSREEELKLLRSIRDE